ncbi:MAG: Prepilin peptidase [Bacillota bacterium]|jgi:leader peptidase (prepilin peptidase)/N-methyltransferase
MALFLGIAGVFGLYAPWLMVQIIKWRTDLTLQDISVLPIIGCLGYDVQWKKVRNLSLFSALFFVLLASLFHFYGLQDKILFLTFLLFVILMAIGDLWVGLIPNLLTYPAFILFLTLRIFYIANNNNAFFLAALIIGIGTCLLAKYTKGLGGGDVKTIINMALILGTMKVLVALCLASLLALLFVIPSLIFNNNSKKPMQILFGPYLAIGGLYAYFWGDLFLCFRG